MNNAYPNTPAEAQSGFSSATFIFSGCEFCVLRALCMVMLFFQNTRASLIRPMKGQESSVLPAEAGIHPSYRLSRLDAGVRRHEESEKQP
jgi:hypothetical protein